MGANVDPLLKASIHPLYGVQFPQNQKPLSALLSNEGRKSCHLSALCDEPDKILPLEIPEGSVHWTRKLLSGRPCWKSYHLRCLFS
jgi:hypothetical protein